METKEIIDGNTESQVPGNTDSTMTVDAAVFEDVTILMEIVESRTEFTKEYKLSNGMYTATYTTTAGSWHAEFPRQLRDGAQFTITKDGFAINFGMEGELRSSGSATATSSALSIQGSTQAMTITGAQESIGQIHDFDYSKEKEAARHPEVVRDKLKSRMSYADVYNNTDIIYDVNSYQLKESIVINASLGHGLC